MDKISSSQKKILSLLGDPQVNFRLKKNLISGSDSNTINKICEIILNVLNKNIPIPAENLKHLKPYALSCRKILNKRTSNKQRKNIIIKKGIQKGGFLQYIIAPLLGLLGETIANFFKKAE